MLDLGLAIVHHLLIFILFGILIAELLLIRKTMAIDDVKRVAKIDLYYGITAVLITIAGFARAIYAAKGWDYYAINLFFWTKIGIFIVIGLVSIWPTVAIIGWFKLSHLNTAPAPATIVKVRRLLWLEVVLFAFLPICAAAMARGYGMWT